MKKYIQNSKSWKDLNKTLEGFTKSKRSKLAGDIFEYLTKLYLKTAPQYKTKLKNVYLLNEVPNNIKKKLNLPNTDEGIDLIAETFDKEYWAIQCKYRSDPNETLTVKGDLSTFNNLAFTYCKNITHAIVCATVNKPPKKIKLLKSIGFETLETWLALDDGDLFTQIKAKAVGKIYKPTILRPRPHQVAAIKKTIDHFKSNERGKIIMPCGTGKSLTAFWIAKQMGVKSILVAVPSLALLQQTLKVWTREFLINGIEPEWFCVCSDGTVKDEQDDYVTDTADLGIKVDTDPSLIKQFLKKKTSKIKVVFTTYQSGRATAKGSKGFTYDLGIMDEAHKTVGSKTKEMAHLLHQKNVRIKKCIFMTATERLFRGDSDEFMSMDDPRDYGSLIYELSFKEAINSKPPIISDYKIITFGITTPEIEEIYQSNKYLEVKKVLKDITAREFATAIALRKAIKKLKIKNAISFHRSIRRADNFRVQQDLITKIFPSYGKLKSFHVRGDMPTSDRAIQMRNFAEGEGLMTNARCLTEGVDLPAIDCVVFTDPKRSKVDIVQAAGRALRLSKGKKFGYILIPIFIPDGADFNEAAEEQGFDDVAITVRALATTDTRITEYLRVISEGKKPRGGSPVDGITSVNSLYKIEAEEFDKAIKLKVWDKVSKSNYRSYEEAKEYLKNLHIKNSREYGKKIKQLPLDFPYHPERVYKFNGWISWGDFLGTGYQHEKQFLDYKDAKKIIHKLKLLSQYEHRDYARKNPVFFMKNNLSTYPAGYYIKRGTWVSWGDYLGHGRVADQFKKFLNYKKAKKLVHQLKFKKARDFGEYAKLGKLPSNIPSAPQNHYKDKGWISWHDFLGTGFIEIKDRNYFNFEEAKKHVKKLKIKSATDFREKRKNKIISSRMPPKPYKTYKNSGWVSWGDFLGTGILSSNQIKYINYDDAKKLLSSKKISSLTDYRKIIKKEFQNQIPINPSKNYKNKEWKGWQDFIGKEIISTQKINKKYISFKRAKSLIQSLGVKDKKEFKKKKLNNIIPDTIPLKPGRFYKGKGWVNFKDFIGVHQYFGYNQAKKIIKKYNIKSAKEFAEQHRNNKFPKQMPYSPSYFYKKQWKSWPIFLSSNPANEKVREFVKFSEAKKIVRKLKLNTLKDWQLYSKSRRPNNIPGHPDHIYKNKGWKDWPDFFGKKK